MTIQLDPAALESLNPNHGFLCIWTYWIPDPSAHHPERPGLKKSVLRYLPTHPRKKCLCGSGRTYHRCCREEQYWQPLCPDPDFTSYSFVTPLSARLRVRRAADLRHALHEDSRLYCTQDNPDHSFWTYWGDPAYEGEFGPVCLGDLELRKDGDLLITALSLSRMTNLLDLMTELPSSWITFQSMAAEPIQVLDKHTGHLVTLPVDHMQTANKQ